MATINETYFSGSQAHLFIGDIWVDDIVNYEYSVQSRATPIYGYGSTHFDHVAEGQVIVQGSFTINFREPNYLWIILEQNQIKNNTYGPTPGAADAPNALDKGFDRSNASFLVDKRKNLDLFFKANNPELVSSKLIQENTVAGVQRSNPDENHFNHKLFNMVIGYGSNFHGDAPGELIQDIKIIGRGKMINPDGQSIKERYQFIAKKVV